MLLVFQQVYVPTVDDVTVLTANERTLGFSGLKFYQTRAILSSKNQNVNIIYEYMLGKHYHMFNLNEILQYIDINISETRHISSL